MHVLLEGEGGEVADIKQIYSFLAVQVLLINVCVYMCVPVHIVCAYCPRCTLALTLYLYMCM